MAAAGAGAAAVGADTGKDASKGAARVKRVAKAAGTGAAAMAGPGVAGKGAAGKRKCKRKHRGRGKGKGKGKQAADEVPCKDDYEVRQRNANGRVNRCSLCKKTRCAFRFHSKVGSIVVRACLRV